MNSESDKRIVTCCYKLSRYLQSLSGLGFHLCTPEAGRQTSAFLPMILYNYLS
jgi:hypothetical protein